LLDVTIKGARGLLISFSGGPDLSLGEVTEAATLITREADPNCNFKFGLASLTEELLGKAKANIIATGIRSTATSRGWVADLGDKITEAANRRGH
jgi:cell division protein FtsZ